MNKRQILLIGLIAATFLVIQKLLLGLCFGMVAAIIMRTTHHHTKKVIGNTASAVLATLTFTALIAAPLVGISAVLISEIPELIDYVETQYQEVPTEDPVSQSVWIEGREAVVGILRGLAANSLDIVQNTAIAVVTMIFTSYYLLKDGQRLWLNATKEQWLNNNLLVLIKNTLFETTDGVLKGQVLTGIVQGLMGFALFTLVGLEKAWFWGLLMMISAMIPFVGAAAVWIPVAIFQYLQGDVSVAITIGIIGAMISQVDNFIRPRLIGNSAHMHPMVAFLGTIGGLLWLGFIGLFIGPIILNLLYVTRQYWIKPQENIAQSES